MNDQGSQHKKTVEELSKIGQSIDWGWILGRIRLVMLTPKGAWGVIKGEMDSVKDIYTKYLIIMAAVPAVAGFVGNVLNAPKHIFTWLVLAVVSYLIALAMVYLIALVLEFLAPKFDGQTSRIDGFKLTAYSYTPSYVAGVLSLIPVLVPLQLLFGIYSLYCFWVGLPQLSTVPDNKRVVYFIAVIVAVIVISIVLGVALAAFGLASGGFGSMMR